jgi:predicted nucleic acid-binding protein
MSSPVYVIDASVFVAAFSRQEPHYRTARQLLAQITANNWQVYVPGILLPEIGAGMSRATGNPVRVRRLVRLIQQAAYLAIADVDQHIISIATDLAIHHRIRGCDAVYVALAQHRNAVLITLDQEQRQRVPPTITARTPAEELAVLQDK